MPLLNKFEISSPHVKQTDKEIVADFNYSYTAVDNSGATPKFVPTSKVYTLKTETTVPKMGYVEVTSMPVLFRLALCGAVTILKPFLEIT